MEVFIRGVPGRETEKSLNNFFKNVLNRLKIEDWTCQKIARKPWAKLIFLSYEDGQRFLSLYGKTKDFSGSNFLVPGRTDLIFKRSHLDCSLSKTLDIFALRNLEMEKKARAEHNKTPAKSDRTCSKMDDRILACTSIMCGLWDYIESGLVFKPYFTLTEPASITFNSKSIVFKTDSSQRLDISYYSIEAFAYEGLPVPAMTFTLREAPRFSESAYRVIYTQQNDFRNIMESVFEDLHLFSRQGPDWNRLPGLNREHQKITGSCLVYRILLTKQAKLDDQIKAFTQTRGITSMVRRHINVCEPREPYATDFNKLVLLL